MNDQLPQQALIAATSAALLGLTIAAGIVKVAAWNYRLTRYRVAPHGS